MGVIVILVLLNVSFCDSDLFTQMIIVYENWVGGKPQQEIIKKNTKKKSECMRKFQNHVLIVLGCKANMTGIWGIAGSLQTTTV